MIQHDVTNITSDIDTSAFSIEMNSSMFALLTKNVYNNIILAPIREWSCNAIDACIEAGVDVDYDVHVPTISNPTFSVRDYGTGLCEDDITGLFSVLGASTKRHSNKYNGTFGIGRMSGLAYATSFTVTSFFNSTEYTYLISIKDGIPANVKLSERSTSEENGLKMSLSVQPSDIDKFRKELEFFYRFSSIKPTLSEPLDIDMSSRITLSGTNWFIFDNPDPYARDAYILMSHVPYKVSTHTYDLPRNCVIELPTGSVSITPGRETLTHDSQTEATIRSAVKVLKAEVTSKVTLDVAAASTPWEQAYIANSYISSFSDLVDHSQLKLDSTFSSSHSSPFYLTQPGNSSFFLADFNGATTRKCDRFKLKKNLVFVKQDIAINFVTAFNSIGVSSYDMIIIKPRSNSLSAIEAMVPAADTWLAHLGVPSDQIVSASDYVAESVKSAPSTKLASTTFQPTTFRISDGKVVHSKGSNIDLASNTDDYLYFEMKGSTPVDDTSLIKASLLLNMYTSNSSSIIGVPQKAIKQVQADPHFTPVQAHLQALLPSLPVFKASSYEASKFLATYTTPALRRESFYPPDIQTLVTIAQHYTSYAYSISDLRDIQVHYPITIDQLTDTAQFEISNKYPLLRFINDHYHSSERQQFLKHYLRLETHYADNPPN